MTQNSLALVLTIVYVTLTGTVTCGDKPPRIVSDPMVKREGASYAISFRVSTPCDVSVRVLVSRKEVVRHLASGMVGLVKAAKPFKPQSLSQSIIWDGTDDAGKKAPPGCTASVSVGMRAKFDKFILWESNGIGGRPPARGKQSCTVTKGGGDEYLVAQESGVHLSTLRVFNKNGKYLRQLWPYGPNRPKDFIEGFLADPDWGASDWDGNRVPLSVNHNAFYFFGSRSRGTVVTTDGCVVALSGYVTDAHSLRSFGPDGLPHRDLVWEPSLAYVWRPSFYVEKKLRVPYYRPAQRWRLAAGVEGDFYLADGIVHVVWHCRAADLSPVPFAGLGKPYLGTLEEAGDDEKHFTGPDDVAVDQDGIIHVLDGERVKVFAKDGTILKNATRDVFPSKGTVVPPAIVEATRNARALKFPHFIRIDAEGRMYLKDHGGKGWDPYIVTDVEGKTFERRKFPWGCGPVNGYSCVDLEGNWYVALRKGRQTPEKIWKFSPSGERLKFGEQDEIIIEFDEPARNRTAPADIKGLYVTRTGDLYVVNTVEKWTGPKFLGRDFHYGNLFDKGDQYNCTRVDVFGPNGKLKRKNLVRSQGLNDVAVDREGNVYVIEATMYHGAHRRTVAQGRRGATMAFSYLTPEQAGLDPKTETNKRFSLTARLMKFSPDGGIRDGEGGKPQLWDYAGVSGLSPWGCGGECPAGQICLDADERIWVPDTFMYSVKAIDRAGNEIIRVGKYGNEDNKGGGGNKQIAGTNIVADPEIPLARPSGMAVWKDYLFISDMYTHRVLRCRLEYADQKEGAVE